jgi:hypothetical protein
LQQWDAALMGGFSYALRDNIHLSVRLDYGLRSASKIPNWAAYNRFIGFNVVYYFR